MGDLFRAGSSRQTKGAFTISHTGGSDIVKRLQKLENGGKVAIQRTVSDFASRAPGWVSKGIRENYGVDTAAIKDAAKKPKRGKTTIKVAGVSVDDITLEYNGHLLTPRHFKMTPKTSNPKGLTEGKRSIPGQGVNFKKTPPGKVATVKTPKPYTVRATIIKGQRVSMPHGTFVSPGKGGVNLPFQRQGEARKPLEVVRTLSVPQMIDGRARETIEQKINEELEKRFQHHIERVTK